LVWYQVFQSSAVSQVLMTMYSSGIDEIRYMEDNLLTQMELPG